MTPTQKLPDSVSKALELQVNLGEVDTTKAVVVFYRAESETVEVEQSLNALTTASMMVAVSSPRTSIDLSDVEHTQLGPIDIYIVNPSYFSEKKTDEELDRMLGRTRSTYNLR